MASFLLPYSREKKIAQQHGDTPSLLSGRGKGTTQDSTHFPYGDSHDADAGSTLAGALAFGAGLTVGWMLWGLSPLEGDTHA